MISCHSCMFNGECRVYTNNCDDYYPASGDYQYDTDNIIERERHEFHEYWKAYVSEYKDDLNFF